MSMADDFKWCEQKVYELADLRCRPSKMADVIKRLTEQEKETLIAFMIAFGSK